MPRQKSLMTVIRDLVQEEVRSAIQGLFGSSSTERRRRRGKWRPGGPGRPPKVVAEKATEKATEKAEAVVAPVVPKATNGRRRKAHRKWRPGGPGRPPKAVALKAVASKAARKRT